MATSRSAFLLLVLFGCAHLPPPGTVGIRDYAFKVRDFKTPSGLRIIVEEDRSRPLVAVVSYVGVGSSSDPQGKEGLAHFVEHLTFRAKQDGKSQLTNLLAYAATADSNGGTSLDHTVYYELAPREFLPSVLTLEAARILRPVANVDDGAFEVEREVVRNELRQRNEMGFDSQAFSAIQASLFPEGHPYARPVVGTHQSLSAITRADVDRFVAEHYRPENVTLVISGDVDSSQIAQVLDATPWQEFSQAPSSGSVPVPVRISDLEPAVPEMPVGSMASIPSTASLPQVYLSWSLPRGFGAHAYLERFVLQALRSEILFAALREPDIVNLDAELVAGTQATMLICRVQLSRGDHPAKSAETVLDQLYRVWDFGGSEMGLRRSAVNFEQIRGGAVVGLALESEDLLARALTRGLGAHFSGDAGLLSRELRAMASVDFSEVSAFAYKYVNRARAHVLFARPLAQGSRPAFSSELTTPARSTPDAVRMEYPTESLRQLAKPPGASRLTQRRLSNGLQLIVGKTTEVPVVTVELDFRGGTATAEPLGVAELARLTAFPLNHLHGHAIDNGVQISTRVGPDSLSYVARGGSGNLPNMLALLSDRVRSMTSNEVARYTFHRDVLPIVRAVKSSAEAQEERTFLAAVYGENPYGRASTADQLDALPLRAVTDWLERTYAPRNARVIVLGDANPEATLRLVETWLGDWAGPPPGLSEVPVAPLASSGASSEVKVLISHRPGATQGVVRLGCAVEAKTPREAAAFALLEHWMAVELEQVARSDQGASYGFTGGATTRRSGVTLLELSGNVENAALTSVLRSLRKSWGGLTDQQFTYGRMNRIRWDLIRAYNVKDRTSTRFALDVSETLNAGFPLESLDRFPEELTSLLPGDMTRAAAACRRRAVMSLAGDEAVLKAALLAGWN